MRCVAVLVSSNLPQVVRDRWCDAFASEGAKAVVVSADHVTGAHGRTLQLEGGEADVDAVLAMALSSAHALKSLSVPVVNDPDVTAATSSKLVQYQLLSDAGVPTPETLSGEAALTLLAEGRPLPAALSGSEWVVTKPALGYGGRAVSRHRNTSDLRRLLSDAPEAMVAQQFLPAVTDGDIRVLVVDREPIAAMRRRPAEQGEWRTNLTLGGDATPHELAASECEIAAAAVRARGLTIAGADLVVTPEGPVVLEVNSVPGMRIAWVTGIDTFSPVAAAVLRRT